MVTRPGFEPRQAESESAVLPLYYRAVRGANLRFNDFIFKIKIIKICSFTVDLKKHFNCISVLHPQNNDGCQKNPHCFQNPLSVQIH